MSRAAECPERRIAPQRFVVLALALALAGFGCARPCATQKDCNVGYYCLEDPGRPGKGSCQRECAASKECEVGNSALQLGRCDNFGKCQISERPPRLRVVAPENDTLLSSSTRQIRLTGEVETAAPEVIVTVTPIGSASGCGVIPQQVIRLENGDPGRLVRLGFTTEDLAVDPGVTALRVTARVGASTDFVDHVVELPCEGCARITVESPLFPVAVGGLVLPEVQGLVAPPTLRRVIWRVRSSAGQVLDGAERVENGRFTLRRIPLFAGTNSLSVSASGGGAGEARCSLAVTAGASEERGFRALLTWDGLTSDLDLHFIGPGGTFGDPTLDLSAASRIPALGTVDDVFTGLGPEVLRTNALPDGVYGLIVEPVLDNDDAGSSAFVRVLYGGRLLTASPLGPQYLTDRDRRLWVVGALRIQGGQAEWRKLDAMVDAAPTRPPADWPTFD